MSPKNPKFLLALAILCLATVAAVGGPRASTLSSADGEVVYAWMSSDQLASFDDFALYWLGNSFDGLELYAVVRELESPAPGQRGRDSVDFLYGDCDASGGGCPFPLSVQVWPACRRNLSMYQFGGRAMPHVAGTIRDVPTASFEDFDGRLELYTGEVTVVIFGDSPERIQKAAHGLRAVGSFSADGVPASGEALPPPVEGALEGRLSCGPA